MEEPIRPTSEGLVRRGLRCMVVVLLVAAACVPGSEPDARGRPDGLEPPRAQERPNVLLIVTDDQRAVGTLGVMPATRRWLAGGGTRFTSAYATTPLCCPARASIMTGRYAHNHGVLTNEEPNAEHLPHRVTVQRYLHDSGYRTAIAGKFLNGWPLHEAPPYFDDYWIYSTGVPYRRGLWNAAGEVEELDVYSTTYIEERALALLRSAEEDDARPWFLVLATPAPHQPSVAEERYADAPVPPMELNPAMTEGARGDKPAFVRDERLPFEIAGKIRREQLRALLSVDDMVGRMAAELDELDETDTLAIYTSDNGMLWGEHGLNGKTFPYDLSVRIPLLVRWPGHVEAGGTDDRLIANIDLAPTILDAAGVSARADMDGMSLLGPKSRRALLLEYWSIPRFDTWDWSALLDRARLFVRYSRGRRTYREYYDLRADPWELHNLLGDDHAGSDPDVRRLDARLDGAVRCAGRGCP